MGGGLMQLVAYGAQDIYLTGNPQITFFKVVYRRHTNFSMESIKQTFDGNADFGGEVVATISRNGDLVHRMYLEHHAKFIATQSHITHHDLIWTQSFLGVVSNYGSNLMKKMEIEIGGQLIDRHYGHYHAAHSELTDFNPTGYHTTLYNRMSGNGIGVQTGRAVYGVGIENRKRATESGWTIVDEVGYYTPHATAPGSPPRMDGKFFIPLNFWFCKNPGLALPLIALQYHEVKVKFQFEDICNLVLECEQFWHIAPGTVYSGIPSNNDGSTFDLWCDYIYLDTDERRRFAQVSHEYLIEQVQHTRIDETDAFTADLNFNHPVKELIWKNEHHPVFSPGALTRLFGGSINAEDLPAGDHWEYNQISYVGAPFTLNGDFQLKLNGHDRFKARDAKYFTRTQVWQHHTGYGGYIGQNSHPEKGEIALGLEGRDTIAVYSFALKPEEHQPSGTCNFSRIDNAQLIRSGTDLNHLYGGVHVYAVNYNVLRIMSGMGGLAYSN